MKSYVELFVSTLLSLVIQISRAVHFINSWRMDFALFCSISSMNILEPELNRFAFTQF